MILKQMQLNDGTSNRVRIPISVQNFTLKHCYEVRNLKVMVITIGFNNIVHY